MYTEDEAMGKWCCADMDSQCVASRCMAWRWAQKANPEWKPRHSLQWPPLHPDEGPPMYLEDRTRGYCGLAGRP